MFFLLFKQNNFINCNFKFQHIGWIEFYGDELNQPNYNNLTYCQLDECENTNKLSPTENNVWITNCYFHEFYSSSSGGAINISGSSSRILFEFSTFFKCKTSGDDAGAIFTESSDTILNHVCGTFCENSNGNCGFCYICGDGPENKNVLLRISTQCIIKKDTLILSQ